MPEAFRCPLCGGSDFDVVLQTHDRVMRTSDEQFRLVRCRGCGLLRVYSQPDSATLSASYASDYAPHVRPGLSGWAKGVLERRSVRMLQEYVGAPKQVVDIGCATGDLLLAVRRAGNPHVTGVETGAGAAESARQRGLDVVTGDLVSASFSSGSFDTALVSHTLEHVGDPVAFLAEVRRILKPGGAVLLWLPNVDSVEARIWRRYWIGYDVPRHLTTFSTGTLGRALRSTGFTVQDIRHEAVGLEWAWGVRLLVREYLPASERFFARAHSLLIVAFSPLAFLSSRLRRSGRIRVIAIRDTR